MLKYSHPCCQVPYSGCIQWPSKMTLSIIMSDKNPEPLINLILALTNLASLSVVPYKDQELNY